MAVVRRNIVTSAGDRQKYIQGVKLLKQEFPGPTTENFGIPGPARQVSTYDLFVAWHHTAMHTFTPPTQIDRNAAHRGPIFLPWHRRMLIIFELHLQRVLNDPNFGLPYWDWAADGQLSASQQRTAAIWSAQCMGGDGSPVTSGPFAFSPTDPTSWHVRLETDPNDQLRATDRGLRRAFGSDAATLPRRPQLTAAGNLATYDAPSWSTTSPGFRNRLEGWQPAPPGLHNRVHAWAGGDMELSTSPNDPVFFLNHCNVDRIWAIWLQRYGKIYVPDQAAPPTLQGQRIDDAMLALPPPAPTPRQMLDVSNLYRYDVQVV